MADISDAELEALIDAEYAQPATVSDVRDAATMQALGLMAPDGVEAIQAEQPAQTIDPESPNAALRSIAQDAQIDPDEFLDTMKAPPGSGSGVTPRDRLALSFKFGGQNSVGGLNYLRNKFGDANVIPYQNREGEIEHIFIRNPETGQLQFVDPESFELGDLADMSAAGLETVFGLGGTALGAAAGAPTGPGAIASAMAGGAVGDTVGNSLKQAIGNYLIPGEESATAGQRLGENIIGTGLGLLLPAGAEGAGRLVGKGVDAVGALSESSLARKILGESGEKAAKNRQIAKEIGLEGLTPGQATGSRELLSYEEAFRSAPKTMDLMSNLQRRQYEQLGRFVDLEIKRLGNIDPATSGTRFVTAHRDAIDRATVQRARIASDMFEKAAVESRGERVIPTDNFRNALQSILDEHTFENAPTPGAQKLAKAVKKQIDNLGPAMTVKELQAQLSFFGKASKGIGKAYPGDKSLNRRLSAQVFGALKGDLEAAAESTAPNSATALKAARDAYREMSKAIEALDSEALSKAGVVFDKGAPDKVAQSIMRTNSPEQIKTAVRIMGKADPGALGDVRASALAEMFDKATAMTADGPVFQPSAFLREWDRMSPKLEALFENNPGALNALKKGVHGARILSQRSGLGSEGSRTTPMGLFSKELERLPIVGGIFSGGKEKGSVALAKILVDPGKRAQLFKIADDAAKATRGAKAARGVARRAGGGRALIELFGKAGLKSSPDAPNEAEEAAKQQRRGLGVSP